MLAWFVLYALGVGLFQLWRVGRVAWFFAQRVPPPTQPVRLVSILQPVASGDPTLAECLEASLRARTAYAREVIWLLDEDDGAAQQVCQTLAQRYPQVPTHLVLLPPPGLHQNPKMFKLMAGLPLAQGDVICILDDDTRLPDDAFETCLPYLEKPKVALVFGLPYYVTFQNLWSQWVACFVNSHSLLTYIPYLQWHEPVTINGMFYCLRRDVLQQIGDFAGLDEMLADDFAICHKVRQSGWQVYQTPVVHGVGTTVTGARHYFSLMQRWFIFPRESLLRYLTGYEQFLVYSLAFAPMFFVWGFVAWAVLWPSAWTGMGLALYLLLHYATFAWFNIAYLRRATPWVASFWIWLLPFTLPVQVLVALASPQRVVWRGNVMEAQQGGYFRIARRRTES
jgi:ceramide glucosyltransferase